jgi:hypothetical protein
MRPSALVLACDEVIASAFLSHRRDWVVYQILAVEDATVVSWSANDEQRTTKDIGPWPDAQQCRAGDVSQAVHDAVHVTTETLLSEVAATVLPL